MLLNVEKLSKNYGGVVAVNSVNLQVNEGEILGVIGPNGAGKTTLFDCITGKLFTTSGKVFLQDEDITRLPTHVIIAKGIARTSQIVDVFPKLTVKDHLMIASQLQSAHSLFNVFLNTSKVKTSEHKINKKADLLLDFFEISHLKNNKGSELSYGQKKLLALAMCLMTDPKIVLLDEPVGGVNETLINKIIDHLKNLHRNGQTFLIIEHNMQVVMELSERVIVLDYGEKIAEGTPEEIQNNEQVLEAYFGR
jgi:branched-chain amino acid transport system ATP-binding protein